MKILITQILLDCLFYNKLHKPFSYAYGLSDAIIAACKFLIESCCIRMTKHENLNWITLLVAQLDRNCLIFAMLRLSILIAVLLQTGNSFNGKNGIFSRIQQTQFNLFSASDYGLMPRMFQIDSYDECFNEPVKFSTNAFCIADIYIKPNSSSRLWSIIEGSSKHWKTQFRHDHLMYGVCIQRCKKFLSKFDKNTQKEYFVKAPKNFPSSIFNPFIYYQGIEDRIEFIEAFSECINYQLRKQYHLEAFAEIQYCDVSGKSEEIG